MATHAARTADRRLARTLGWLGVGTGVGALAAPRALATLVGAPDRREAPAGYQLFTDKQDECVKVVLRP